LIAQLGAFPKSQYALACCAFHLGRSGMRNCTVSGCDKDVRSSGAQYCEMHYARLRRSGTTERQKPSPFYIHSGGYILVYAPDHPLTQTHTGSHEYQHRMVYFNTHGAGPFRCHWCNDPVEWSTMHVDHLNEIVDDNRPENLVASCPICNQRRGRNKMIATMRRLHGTWIYFRGQRKMLTDWAESIGVTRTSLQARLKAGWPLERALTERRGKFGPRRGCAEITQTAAA
jgi:hypothetical protein